jgi:hypothetical protein
MQLKLIYRCTHKFKHNHQHDKLIDFSNIFIIEIYKIYYNFFIIAVKIIKNLLKY